MIESNNAIWCSEPAHLFRFRQPDGQQVVEPAAACFTTVFFFVRSCNTGKAAQQTSLGQHEAPRDTIERFDKERDRGAGDSSKLNCKFSSEVYF